MRKPAHPGYEGLQRKKLLALLVTIALLLVAVVISAGTGSIKLTPWEVISTLFGGGDSLSRVALFENRLPRTVAAILVGAALGMSGAVMQCVLNNPLASASTLGVSQGAAFGAAVGIIVFGGGVTATGGAYAVQIDNPYIVTLCAFVCGSASTVVIVAISRLRRDLGPGALVLAGVALSSLFTGGSTLLQYFADDTQLGAVVFWTFGDLGSTNWSELAMLLAVDVAALIYFLLKRWDYNAIHSGSDTAASLGVNVKTVTLVSMTVCTVASALAVSFVGIISFIGLVAPHAMRRFVGDDYRWLLPCSAAGGALLLILADLVSRVLIAPTILPVGAITSFLGAPVFLYLLLKGGSRSA
ncbi:MAG TPA: iron ABC transporter permease [Candidatus Scatomorpha pullicola]|nr:iron ABC transporter permease [Candidatus Scatomorpha pullicola]